MYKIAIVGRPNVGKSTLFNKLIGKTKSIVADSPGMTRDWQSEDLNLEEDLHLQIIDTAGLYKSPGELDQAIHKHNLNVINDSDAIVFLVDGIVGRVHEDDIWAKYIRKLSKPVIVAVNKCDTKRGLANVSDFYKLGFDNVVSVSAAHSQNLSLLKDKLRELIKQNYGDAVKAVNVNDDEETIDIAIVGRPNAGKSTLFNKIIGKKRSVVSNIAGTTRDSVSYIIEYKQQKYKLIDTAGLRKTGKVDDIQEKFSVDKTLEAINFAHIVILLIDIEKGFEHQDMAIASRVINEGRGLIIAVNKVDTLDQEKQDALFKNMHEFIGQKLGMSGNNIIKFISAKDGRGVKSLLGLIKEIYKLWNIRITTGKLNAWLSGALEEHVLPLGKHGKRITIKFVTQPKSRPPFFVFFCSQPSSIPEHYRKYLTNHLRNAFNLTSVPIRLNFRKKENPFES